jgi:hypothetical protein
LLKNGLRVCAVAAVAPRSLVAGAEAPLPARPARNLALNRAAWASSSADFIHTGHMATDGQMMTQWLSKGGGAQWIYVDLGSVCEVNKVVLRWGEGYARAYKIQVSMERAASPLTGLVEKWSDAHEAGSGKGAVEEIALKPVRARFVRLVCTEAAGAGGYELNGFEVHGTGGPAAKPNLVPPPHADGTLELSGGWKLVSQEFVGDDAGKISSCGFEDGWWLPAVVPGTVLTSYLNAGAVPDLFYGDDMYQVSEWFAHGQWWYRNEMTVPASYAGKRVWLNLDGINYKADVYVNGSPVGKMAGAFIRGHFDITGKVAPGKKNCIAVLIHPVTNPCKPTVRTLGDYSWPEDYTHNAPTFVESAGWDWLPTIRDRNIGIWNKVSLTTSGDVTIADPFVTTELPLRPDVSRADLTLKVELRNHSDKQRTGKLNVGLGALRFSHPVTLEAGETRSLSLDKGAHPELSLKEARLWWPNGCGEQHLYDLSLRFETEGGGISDAKTAKVGVRKLTYNQDPIALRNVGLLQDLTGKANATPTTNPLTISCNGQRILLKGADWGMDEGMLRCDGDGYETRVRYEKEMNFNLIRNCLGNVHKQEFFEACDRHGIFVWEEFGVNHNNMPYDVEMWLSNARDRILATRNHACVALWCTANEGASQEPILSAVPKMVDALDGTRLFLQHSTQHPPTDGDGPYVSMPPKFYLSGMAHGFRAEIGSPNVPPVESMRRMMPHDKLWPINEMWGTHDWWEKGWQDGDGVVGHTEKAIACYGEAAGIEDFCRKSQMVNLEVFKAIYESWNEKMWDNCSGVMIWMSNPCWPSLVWNTYDYFLEPTGAYFGIRKACEPLHIQWSMATNDVKLVNCTLKGLEGVRAEARVYNLDGSLALKKAATLDLPANGAHLAFNLFAGEEAKAAALSEVYFIRLELKGADGKLLSDNFYWNAKEVWKYKDLAGMGKVKLSGEVTKVLEGDRCKLTVKVANANKDVAFMIRLKVVDPATGLLVAPIYYSENYFSLTPGETREIAIEYRGAAAGKVMVEGWNVAAAELAVG